MLKELLAPIWHKKAVARTGEVRLAGFSEREGEIWNLPADRTKTGKARRIPLSSETASIVRHCKAVHEGDNLFPAYRGQAISDAGMSTLMKRQNFEFRPHGFRATFRTWVEEQTDAPFEVKEACLGHVVDTGVVGAYQRSDRLEKAACPFGAMGAISAPKLS